MLQHLICFAFFIVAIECQTKCPTFSCYDDKTLEDKILLFGSTNLTCPQDTVCNKFGIDECTPCVSKGALCYGKYTCKAVNNSDTDSDTSTDTIVVIGNLEFVCPNNFTCQPPSDECIPCTRGKCKERQQFDCDESDPTKVQFPGGFVVTCNPGMVCNNRWEQPCQPCVPREVPATLRYVNYLTRLVK